MKAQLTMSQLHNNVSLMKFFFRNQATETFEELIESVEESESQVYNAIENYSDDLDDIEELFYEEQISDLCEMFGLTLLEEE